MTSIINHTKRLTIIGGAIGASLVGVSAYAALNPSPGVQQAQAELKRVIDAKGNITYTINGHTYVVDPKLTDAERRVTVLDLARQTSTRMHDLLAPHNGSQGWPTGPHGETVMSGFYGRVVSIASDRLIIEGPRFWMNDGSQQQYEFKINQDTVFQNGDTKINVSNVHPGQTICLGFYIDPTTYNESKVLKERNLEVSSQELAKATKTLYAGIVVPFTANEYVNLLNNGGVQEQDFPGQPLVPDPDGKTHSVVVPSGD